MSLDLVSKFFRLVVFISYSHRDSATVDKIVAILSAARFACWQDKRELEPIYDFDNEIKSAIRRSWTVVVFVSAHSITSKWVLEEAKYALAHRKRILIVKLDDSALPPELGALERLQWIHLRGVRKIGRRLCSLLLKWRFQRRISLGIRVVAVGVVALAPLCAVEKLPRSPAQFVIESELLPAQILIDGKPMQSLTSLLPRNTIESITGFHLVEAQCGGLRAEKRVRGENEHPSFVLFTKEEFR